MEGEKFCGECGAKIEETVETVKTTPDAPVQSPAANKVQRSCPRCGSGLREESRFCKKCGLQIPQSQQTFSAAAQVKLKNNNSDTSKTMTDYTGLRIILCVICVVLVVIGIIFIPGKIKERTAVNETATSQISDQTPDPEEGKL